MFSSVQEPFKTMPLTTDWSHVGCTKQETDYHIRICGVDYDVNISRYVGITLSVSLSVCLCRFVSGPSFFCFIHDPDTFPFDLKVGFLKCLCVRPTTSVWLDFGIPYLAHGSITTRECVAFIHDPNMMLAFDPNVKFIGLLTCLCVWATAFLSSYRVTPHLAHECITKGWCVTDLCMTLTFDLNI